MTTIHSLLVATDFSDDGKHAVRRAALLAHEHGASLHILHVLKPEGCRPLRDWFSRHKDIELKAAQALGALQRVSVEIQGAYGVIASVEVVVGDPYATLMKASERADLVVLGRRGRSRLEELLGGGAAERVLRTCKRPVLVVSLPAEKPYGRVLVPIDFTAACDAALGAAGLLRGRTESTLHVFHAIDTQREAVLRDADVPEHIIRETRMMEEAGTHVRMRRRAARVGLYGDSTRFALAYGPQRASPRPVQGWISSADVAPPVRQ